MSGHGSKKAALLKPDPTSKGQIGPAAKVLTWNKAEK